MGRPVHGLQPEVGARSGMGIVRLGPLGRRLGSGQAFDPQHALDGGQTGQGANPPLAQFVVHSTWSEQPDAPTFQFASGADDEPASGRAITLGGMVRLA